MYGQGGGLLSSGATGVSGAASTVAGIAVLPNTGGSLLLTVLGLITLGVGVLVTTSFVVTRISSVK
jgi:hypothetical protein